MPPWGELASLFDERWYLAAPASDALGRVRARHEATGKPPSVAASRVANNDMPNLRIIESTSHRADLSIPSFHEGPPIPKFEAWPAAPAPGAAGPGSEGGVASAGGAGAAAAGPKVTFNLFWPVGAVLVWGALKLLGVL